MKSNKDKSKKLLKWKEIFDEADSLGVSRSKHIKNLGYTKDTYYYWKKQLILNGMIEDKSSESKLKERVATIDSNSKLDSSSQGFVKLDFSLPTVEPVKVIVNGFEILIPTSASVEQIKHIMRIAKNA